MNRRTLLSAVGSGLAAAVAGCVGSDGDGSGGGDGTENGTDTTTAPANGTTDGTGTGTDPATDDSATTDDASQTPADSESGNGTDAPSDGSETPTDGGTPDPTGSVGVETTFEVTDSGCGGGAEEAAVAVEGDIVTVEGVAQGSDGCHTARLADASVEGGTLTVAVETYVPESEQGNACIECIVDIAYTATATVAETLETVVVVHDGERVAQATP